jgi:hypothetical protein
MNATRLGVRARRVLLNDERLEEYEQEAACWVQGLDPQTDAETEVVLDVVDVRIRLGRLEKALRAKTEAALANTVTEAPGYMRLRLTQNALTLLAAMKTTIDQTVITESAKLESFLSPVRNVLRMVAEVQAEHNTLVKGLVQSKLPLTSWPSSPGANGKLPRQSKQCRASLTSLLLIFESVWLSMNMPLKKYELSLQCARCQAVTRRPNA